MLPLKILIFLFSIKTALSTCHCENKKSGFESGRSQYKVTRLGKLDKVVNESSGIEIVSGDDTFWAHNDGGITALYKTTKTGVITDTVLIPGIRNTDWEDLAQDDSGNLYIGDFGNNKNIRRNLTIYKVNPSFPQLAQAIHFRYSDQKDFPPGKKDLNFDCEAFFWYADSLYLFSKNRGRKQVKLYTIPTKPGEYSTDKLDEIYLKSQVTAADINPDQDMFAVLTYGKIFLFKRSAGKNWLEQPYLCIKIARGQTEALVFINDTDFIITNEKGKIFLVTKKR